MNIAPPLRRFDSRLHSLAAGAMIDFAPEDTVRAAAAAGWPACGLWYDHSTWTKARTHLVRSALDNSAIVALDIEPVIVGSDDDHGEALVDVGAELGARFVLFTSRIDDWSNVIERFGVICDRAAQANMVVVCEFLPIFPLATLADAHRIVSAAARPNGAILVDNLHLRTSGATASDLGAYDPSLFPYIQIADAAALAPLTFGDRLDEALNQRRWPGDGELPIDELLDHVGNIPVSYEVRSQANREAFRTPVERAQYALAAVRAWHDA
jgi:sugar phosphate isomerase/epimerase